MKIYLVRHGVTEWNKEGRLQGQTDTTLSDEGLAQADAAAERLAHYRLEAVVSSPLVRARATAMKIFGAQESAQFDTDDDLMEVCHGDWEGLTAAEVLERWPAEWAEMNRMPHARSFPGERGESLASLQRRALRAIARITSRFSGDVAAVSHGTLIKVLLLHYLDAPLSSYYRISLGNCAIAAIELRDGKPPRVLSIG